MAVRLALGVLVAAGLGFVLARRVFVLAGGLGLALGMLMAMLAVTVAVVGCGCAGLVTAALVGGVWPGGGQAGGGQRAPHGLGHAGEGTADGDADGQEGHG